MRQPRLVEVQRIDIGRQRLLEHFHVVDDPVVSALRDRQDPRLLVLGLAREWIRVDAPADALRPELVEPDGPDDAEMVTRRR